MESILNIETILKNLIKYPAVKLSPEDQKKIALNDWEGFIYGRLTTSKYRSSSIPDELNSQIKEKIRNSISQNKPIHITVPFGGFKKWQLPTFPDIDWSEIFNLILLREYLSPIAAYYKPGVILEYFSDEIFASRMNNISQEDLDLYNDHFTQIIEFFNQFQPDNFKIKFSKIRDQISQEELFKRFEKTIVELKQNWQNIPQDEREKRLVKSERNYKMDFSKITKEEKDKILLESTLIHDAFIFGDWDSDVPWAFDDHMIAIGFRYTNKWGISIRSSRSSTVQFWVGIGVLKQKGNEFIPGILTYQQYLDNKSKLQSYDINIFDKKFKNLQSICILP